ncbi:hypothetical protein [Lysobacter sp. D1-1-M9]|uniref:hypothetical protein n=1 Tax=Novilysobacter longmucuonensis TaxID=3098603 RepID=UPI002FC78F54
MSFDKLLHKVEQAEAALEARERQCAADVRQFRRTWQALWTPGRILIAGLAGGFLSGRAEPLRAASQGGGLLRIVSTLSTLMASTGARSAADEAEQAADSVEDVARQAPHHDTGHPDAQAASAAAPAGLREPVEP